MRRPMKTTLACLAATLLAVPIWAAECVAEWTDFSSEHLTSGAMTLDLNGNTHENGYAEIGTAPLLITGTAAWNPRNSGDNPTNTPLTLVLRFSNLTNDDTLTELQALVSLTLGTSDNMVGLMTRVGGGAPVGMWSGNSYTSNATMSALPSDQGEYILVFTYGESGTQAWVLENGAWNARFTCGGLRGGGTVGGKIALGAKTDGTLPATGLRIHAVSVWKGALSESERNGAVALLTARERTLAEGPADWQAANAWGEGVSAPSANEAARLTLFGDATLTMNAAASVGALAVDGEGTLRFAPDTEGNTLTSPLTLVNANVNATSGVASLGAVSIAAGKTLTVSTTPSLSIATGANAGTLQVIGGSEASPVVLSAGNVLNADIGQVELAENTTLRLHATGGNKVYRVRGAGSSSVLLLTSAGQGWGLTANGTALDNLTLVIPATVDGTTANANFWMTPGKTTSTVHFRTERQITGENAAGTFDFASIAGSGNFLGAGRHLRISDGANAVYSGVFSGAGSFAKVGEGTQTLSGANTYTGGTTIEGGVLKLTDGGVPGTGTVTINSGTLEVAANASKTLANAFSGVGAIEKTGIGTASLTGDLSGFTGAVTVAGGTLDVSTATFGETKPTFAVSTGELIATAGNEGTVTVSAGATLKLKLSAAQLLSGYDASRHVTLEGETKGKVVFVNSADHPITDGVNGATYTSPLNTWTPSENDAENTWANASRWSKKRVPAEGESVRLCITGDATLTVESNVTVADVSIEGEGEGTLTLNGEGCLMVTNRVVTYVPIEATPARLTCAALDVMPGVTLVLPSNTSPYAFPITLEAGAILSPDDGVTVSGVISGAGGVAIEAGTVTFSGANTYSGGTTIADGATLEITNGATLGTGTLAGAGRFTVKDALPTPPNGLTDSTWTGRVVFALDINDTGVNPGMWGNAASEIEFAESYSYTGCFSKAGTCSSHIILSGRLLFNNGWSDGGGYTFTGKLSGTGTLETAPFSSNADPSDVIQFTGDVSEFSGAVTMSANAGSKYGHCIVLGGQQADSADDSMTGRLVIASSEKMVAVPSDKTWSATRGVIVRGMIGGSGTIGSTLTFEEGSTLDISAGALTVTGAVSGSPMLSTGNLDLASVGGLKVLGTTTAGLTFQGAPEGYVIVMLDDGYYLIKAGSAWTATVGAETVNWSGLRWTNGTTTLSSAIFANASLSAALNLEAVIDATAAAQTIMMDTDATVALTVKGSNPVTIAGERTLTIKGSEDEENPRTVAGDLRISGHLATSGHVDLNISLPNGTYYTCTGALTVADGTLTLTTSTSYFFAGATVTINSGATLLLPAGNQSFEANAALNVRASTLNLHGTLDLRGPLSDGFYRGIYLYMGDAPLNMHAGARIMGAGGVYWNESGERHFNVYASEGETVATIDSALYVKNGARLHLAIDSDVTLNVNGVLSTLTDSAEGTKLFVDTGTMAFAGDGSSFTCPVEIAAEATVEVYPRTISGSTVANALGTGAISGAGTLVAKTSQLSSVNGLTAEGWTGTVKFDTAQIAGLALAAYGNVGSTIILKDTGATLAASDVETTIASRMVLEGAVTLFAGTSDYTFGGALSGTGDLILRNGGNADCLKFTGDCSNFAGAITVQGNRCIAFGSGERADGKIVVGSDAELTVATGKQWTAANGITLDGTLNVSESTALGTAAAKTIVTGSGRLVVSGNYSSNTDVLAGVGGLTEADWTGTVVLKTTGLGSQLVLCAYGNANSTIECEGVEGWIAASPALNMNPSTVSATLKLVGDESLTLVSGSSSSVLQVTFQKLAGDGTLRGAQDIRVGYNYKFKYDLLIQDASAFKGTIDLTNGGVESAESQEVAVVFAQAFPEGYSHASAAGKVLIGNAVTIPEGRVWKAATGAGDTIEVLAGGTIGGAGTIGSALTLADGATLNAAAGALTVTETVTTPGTVTVQASEPGVVLNAEGLDATKFALAEGAPANLTLVATDSALVAVAVPEPEAETPMEAAARVAIAQAAAAKGVTSVTSVEGNADAAALFTGVVSVTPSAEGSTQGTATVAYDFGIQSLTIRSLTVGEATVPAFYVVLAAKVQGAEGTPAGYLGRTAVKVYRVGSETDEAGKPVLKEIADQVSADGLPGASGTEPGVKWIYFPYGSLNAMGTFRFKVKASPSETP